MTRKYFRTPFASAGDRTAIPDDHQVNGAVSYTDGFGVAYQGNLEVDSSARAVERDKHNEILFELSNAIRVLQEFGGATDFITAAENVGVPFPYKQYCRVVYNGVVYESVIDNNTDVPPTANWAVVDIFDGNKPGFIIESVSPAHRLTPPPGYLYCNGQNVSRATYARLWAALGSPNTGDGITTFSLPDFRGFHSMGLDDGANRDPGRTLGSVQLAQVGTHAHDASSVAVGDHAHGATSNPAGAHAHGGIAENAGNHSHTAWATTGGTHAHGRLTLPVGQSGGSARAWGTDSLNNGNFQDYTDAAGGHTHAITVDGVGYHSHTLSISATGDHAHGINIAAAGSHSHAVSVTMAAGLVNRVPSVAVIKLIKT